MITPNKTITLDGSVLSKLGIVLGAGCENVDVVSLYQSVSGRFESIDEFLLTLDTLYVLGKIRVDDQTRILSYAT